MRLDQTPKAYKSKTTQGKYPGIQGTIDHMKQLAKEGQAHPKIRGHAVEVVRQVQPKDYLSEVAALYYDTCRRLRYTRDPAEVEYVQHPYVTLQNRAADCDDMATYQAALLGSRALSIGAPIAFVTVGFTDTRGVNQYTHVFTQVRDPRVGWVVIDPVAGPKGREMLRKVRQHKVYES